MAIHYHKLVRDRIPEIIEADGKRCRVRVLDERDYRDKLVEKLREELMEYEASRDLEELADLYEVMLALLALEGEDRETLERRRRVKAEKRGGFEGRLLLETVGED